MRRHLLAAAFAVASSFSLAQVTPICQLQGTGPNTPYAGQTVTTTGIITAIHLGSGSLGGYFIEDPTCDTDPLTSNGLFVYQPNATGLSVGQRVQVTGSMLEFQGLTELSATAPAQVLGTGTVTPTDLTLPVPFLVYFERYEGMLVRIPGDLVVTDVSDWVQYGQVTLAPERLMTPTEVVDPNDAVASGTTTLGLGNVAAVTAQADLNSFSRLILDDGRNASYPSPPPLIGAEGTLRAGSTVTNLTAVLSYGYNAYRLQPAGAIPLVHALRPPVPAVGGQLRVASLNVLNYWTTLGQWGAANSAELGRQRTKLVSALAALDADVLVLHELQANTAAPADLLAALNAVVGSPYTSVPETYTSGGTKSVMWYRAATVTPCTPLYTLNTTLYQRPHYTQGFLVNATGGRVLVSGMHLRSKICGGGSQDDQDLGDGQGCFNGTRRDQVDLLLQSWSDIRQATGIDAQVVLGDMNAYGQEDPVDLLRANGFSDLLPAGSYSYFYAGAFGTLDHAFGTQALVDALSGAGTWPINSDEPPALSYADANLALYQPNAFRCSDHDPVLVGLDAFLLPVGIADQREEHTMQVRVVDDMLVFTPSTGDAQGPLRLLDALGRAVGSWTMNGTTLQVPTRGLAPGAYLWRFEGDAPQGGSVVTH
ncbi:MAG: ExeM/NucH family extracellular endonuclease [Flavobacteriales bacterium]|nr:ExeM/NucH family extracellular endonuclease [Flavobacteriales bacterium]